jgi:hypothetical protein
MVDQRLKKAVEDASAACESIEGCEYVVGLRTADEKSRLAIAARTRDEDSLDVALMALVTLASSRFDEAGVTEKMAAMARIVDMAASCGAALGLVSIEDIEYSDKEEISPVGAALCGAVSYSASTGGPESAVKAVVKALAEVAATMGSLSIAMEDLNCPDDEGGRP